MSRKDRRDGFWLPENPDRSHVRDAENARRNRAEITRALSHGQVSRRDLVKWGLFTSAGILAPIGGLSPFVRPLNAASSGFGGSRGGGSGIPTGLPRSPLFGVLPFTAPMPRFDVLSRNPVSTLSPAPQAQSNQTQQPLDPALVGGQTGLTGPIEGRPPGAIWAHQRFSQFTPQVAIEVNTAQATANTTYNPGVPSSLNSGIDPTQSIPLKFHPSLPTQQPNSVWTFNGTIPPKLAQVRYGEPVLFRNHNRLPADVTQNNGFGRNTLTTHEHNGHHGAENDGFTGAYFFPNQFYDYHWPWVLAGFNSINTTATDPRAGAPDGSGGINKVPGDWHETMSSHWFHDHMFSFTAQNVYKGIAAMNNIYSSLDRGNEAINDGVNLRLPSGTAKDWGNLDYDVNLLFADKAWDANGQLNMDILAFNGFLGDAMTVNLTYKPFFQVERRKYRFRILNASVSRFFVFALSDSSAMIQIGNDGNLLPCPVTQTQLDQLGIAERYDIVVDFSRYSIGQTVDLVNLQEHTDGQGPGQILSVSGALGGQSSDPCVGACLRFQVVRNPAQPDQSQVPATLIPNPTLPTVVRQRQFVFGRNAQQTTNDPVTSYALSGDWGIGTNNSSSGGSRNSGGSLLKADFGRISSAPAFGTTEIWTLVNLGSDWDHPIHIHFEEGQILARNGSASNVPAWEKGRKDVYRLRANGSVTLAMQFRDWGGMFMEHCHNTEHEDNAMLMRWEINNAGGAFLNPLPTPIPKPTGVTFQAPDQILPSAF
ncbi:MAG TPA: multicopper oxidase domain-containing protein [Candidatus Saccharimonadales bacterium]|jgi:FtsP/CotA-like multicopper oxidase with cupredoxin domain|nr:multicopper oxidase domain-containing protein [Candidatus Saccharimonadales bacterium]